MTSRIGRRSAVLAVLVLLLTSGCASDLAEIPSDAGASAASAPPPTVVPTDAETATIGTDLAACIARSGFTARPVEAPLADSAGQAPEVLAAERQQLLQDQARYDMVFAQCVASTPTPTPTP